MIDDPVVQILCEAAARGRQLRLAREQAARSEPRSDGHGSEAALIDQSDGMTMTSQRDDNAVGKETST